MFYDVHKENASNQNKTQIPINRFIYISRSAVTDSTNIN